MHSISKAPPQLTPNDSYDPARHKTAPLSVRPNAMELLWVCGDCGHHLPRTSVAPTECPSCGGPREHFYSPPED